MHDGPAGGRGGRLLENNLAQEVCLPFLWEISLQSSSPLECKRGFPIGGNWNVSGTEEMSPSSWFSGTVFE